MGVVVKYKGVDYNFPDGTTKDVAVKYFQKKFGTQSQQPKPAVTGKEIMDQAKKNVFSQMERGQKIQDAGVALGKSGYMNTLAGLMTAGKNLDPVRYVNSKLPFQASKDYITNQDAAIQAVQNKSKDYVTEAETTKPQNMDVIDNVAMGSWDMLTQTPKYMAANILGPVMGFAGLSGIDAVGQGKEGMDVVKEVLKGAVTGKVFKKSEGMNRLAKPVVLGSTMAGMTALDGGSKEDVQTAFASGAVLGLMGGKKAKEQQKNLLKKAELKADELRRGVRQFIPEKQDAAFSYDVQPENYGTKSLIRPEVQSKTFETGLMSNAGKREFIPTEKPNAYHAGGKPEEVFLKSFKVGEKLDSGSKVKDIQVHDIQYPDSMVYSAEGGKPLTFAPKVLESGKIKLVPDKKTAPISVSIQKETVPFPDQYSYKLTKDFENRVSNQKSVTPQDVFEVNNVSDFDQKISNYVFGSEKIKPDPTQPRTANFFARFTDAIGEKINQKLDTYKSSGKIGSGAIDFLSQRAGRSQEFLTKGDEFRGGKDYSLNLAKNLKDKINIDLDQVSQMQVSKVLRGEAKPESLSKNLKSKYQEIRSLNDAIHETNYGANGIRASQVKRLYQTGEITDAQYKARMKDIQGVYKANKGKYYANMYELYELTDSPQHTGGKGMNTNMYKSRKDIPKEWKDANVINDPGFITAKRVLDTYMNVEYYKYADYIHKQQNMWSTTPRKGYIQIPESNSYGLLAGKYVRSDAARDILGFVSSIDSMNSLYKSLQIMNVPRQYIKAGKTVLNPGVWAGNDVSNRFFSLISGAPELSIPNNKWARFANEQMNTNGAYYRDLQKAGIIGTDFAKQEFKYDVNNTLSEPKKNLLSRAYNKASKKYGDIDNRHKIAAYKYWLDKGMTREQAIAKVKASYQDYSRVSWAWDVGSKLPVIGKPFAKFTPELVRILTNSAKQNPLWTMAVAGSLYALNEYTSNQFETPEQRGIRESDPRSSKIFGAIPTTFITPWGEVDVRRWLMMNQLTQVNEKAKSDNLLARAGVPDVLNFTDTNGDVMLSPLLQVAQNENYVGKPIWKDAGERGIDAVGKVATHFADSYLPVPITPNSLNKISSALTTNEGNLNTNILDAGVPDKFGKRRSPAQVAFEVGAGLRFRTMKDDDLKEIQDRVSIDLQNDTSNRIKQINSYMYQRGVSEKDKLKFLDNAIQYATNDYANDPEKQAEIVASIKDAGEKSLVSFKTSEIYEKIKNKPINEKIDVWASYVSKDQKIAKKLLSKIKSNMFGKSSGEERISSKSPDVQAAYLEFKIEGKTKEQQQKIIQDLLSRQVISKSGFKRYIERGVGL